VDLFARAFFCVFTLVCCPCDLREFFYTLFLEGVYFCEGVSGHDGSDDILRVFRVSSAMTIAVGAAEFG